MSRRGRNGRCSFRLLLPGLALALYASSGGAGLAAAQTSTPDEQDRIDRLEAELAAIRDEVAEMKAELAAKNAELAAVAAERAEAAEPPQAAGGSADRWAEIERRIEILAREIERQRVGEGVFRKPEKSEHGLGVAASKIYQTEQGLSIGGYGEMVFQDPESSRDDGAASGATAELDFLRAVFYFGYKFNDRWLFNSEIEVEHGSTDQGGSVSVEFAYLDYLWRPQLNLRAGMVLIPMGFVNELHEPPLFLGALRPEIERRIIPTTWRENGLGLFGEAGGFGYRSYWINGLRADGFSSNGIRGGRQKGSEALAEDLAWSGRLDYTGSPGLLLGVSAYVGDSGQDLIGTDGRAIDARTTIFDLHLEWKYRGFELRALAVEAAIDDVARLNAALGLSGGSSIGEKLDGYYLQVGYDVLASAGRGQRASAEAALIPYARYETFDTQAAVPPGFTRNPARSRESLTLGVAYKPIDELVFKLDFLNRDDDAGSGVDQLNLAVGYLF